MTSICSCPKCKRQYTTPTGVKAKCACGQVFITQPDQPETQPAEGPPSDLFGFYSVIARATVVVGVLLLAVATIAALDAADAIATLNTQAGVRSNWKHWQAFLTLLIGGYGAALAVASLGIIAELAIRRASRGGES